MTRGKFFNGFAYLIMLSVLKRGSAGAQEVRSDLVAATAEEMTLGGVSSTLKTLHGNGDLARERSRVKGRNGKGAGPVYHYSLTADGAARVSWMNRAVRALLPHTGQRYAGQPGLSSLAPSQIPKISRQPSALTALATSSGTLRTSKTCSTAYRSQRNEKFLVKRGLVSMIHFRKPPRKTMLEPRKKANAARSCSGFVFDCAPSARQMPVERRRSDA